MYVCGVCVCMYVYMYVYMCMYLCVIEALEFDYVM